MKRDRDYYDTGETVAGLVGVSIIITFFIILCRFLLFIIGTSIKKIGLMSTVCMGICIFNGVILLDRVFTPFLHQSNSIENWTDHVQLFWHYFSLQRGTPALEYACLGMAFALLFGMIHHALKS